MELEAAAMRALEERLERLPGLEKWFVDIAPVPAWLRSSDERGHRHGMPEGMESECVWVIFAGPRRGGCSLPLPLRWPLPLPLWNVAVDVGDSPSPSPICPDGRS